VPQRRGSSRQPGASGRAKPANAAGRPATTALRERLAGVIEPVAAHAGFELERVAVSRVGRRHSVRVVIDRDEGVGLDAIAEVSRAVSEALDAADESGAAVIPGEYVLEISSPGVDRPLTEPRHWRRNVGRLVTVSVAGEPLTGRIVDADDHGVLLEVDGTRRELPSDQLGPGRIQVELRHAEYEGEDEAR
jgi:ribosome maturation factor RimP